MAMAHSAIPTRPRCDPVAPRSSSGPGTAVRVRAPRHAAFGPPTWARAGASSSSDKTVAFYICRGRAHRRLPTALELPSGLDNHLHLA